VSLSFSALFSELLKAYTVDDLLIESEKRDYGMLITTGKVRGGTIQVDTNNLPEGAKVTVLAQEGDETFALDPEDEARLLAAIAEVDRGETVSVSQILEHIRKS
jgi:hypothetical protein